MEEKMPENERHTMIMVSKDTAGAEEWFCPTCGRRFVMHWPPEFKRTILEPGDESVIHVGGKGDLGLGLSMDEVEVHPSSEVADKFELSSLDEKYLSPWVEWMDQVGFENLWYTN
jgi:hypothetical protein